MSNGKQILKMKNSLSIIFFRMQEPQEFKIENNVYIFNSDRYVHKVHNLTCSFVMKWLSVLEKSPHE